MSDTTTTTKAPDSGIVRLDDEEGVKRVLVDTLFGLWTTINNLTRLRPSKRERFRVTIIGSTRTEQTIPQCVDTADEAIAIIRARHAAWTPER
jgi:hypothetical protein